MKKIVLIFSFAVLLCNLANAQFISLGLKGGANFSDQSMDIGNFDLDPSHRSGFNAGLSFAVNLPVIGLGVEADVLYSQKGCKFDMINPLVPKSSNIMDIKTRFSYIEVPI